MDNFVPNNSSIYLRIIIIKIINYTQITFNIIDDCIAFYSIYNIPLFFTLTKAVPYLDFTLPYTIFRSLYLQIML